MYFSKIVLFQHMRVVLDCGGIPGVIFQRVGQNEPQEP